MSFSEIVIKIIGIVLAVVGFGLLISAAGINIFGIGAVNIWVALILGFIFLGLGIWIVRGGNVTI